MAGKYIISTTLLFLSLTLSAADISEIRASAIRKMVEQKKTIDNLAFKLNIPDEQHKMQTHTETRIDYGNVLSERAHFEIEQLAVASRLIADLMKAGKDVVKCMDDRKVEAQKENDRFLMNAFYQPVRESRKKQGDIWMDEMHDWSYKRKNLYNEYNKLYEDVLDLIQNTENLSEISSALNKLLSKGEFFAKSARESNEKVTKAQRDNLEFGDERVNALRQFTRSQVDKTAESLQDCFYIHTAYFNIKNILNKLM